MMGGDTEFQLCDTYSICRKPAGASERKLVIKAPTITPYYTALHDGAGELQKQTIFTQHIGRLSGQLNGQHTIPNPRGPMINGQQNKRYEQSKQARPLLEEAFSCTIRRFFFLSSFCPFSSF